MKIAMFTNTYLPHLGGVARSINTFEDSLRARGHVVKVVAPEFDGAEKSTDDVFRVPAIQNFNGSDFSVRIAVPSVISDFLDAFEPDVIHSHHPFLLGDSAVRAAWERQSPIVFTHHTLYENYTHYVPLDSDALKRMVIQLATDYCNLCNAVIAPSQSIQRLLTERGVTVPIHVNPTGIDPVFFNSGNGSRFRGSLGIAGDAFVIGHLGRLAPEKNLNYLAEAVGHVLAENRKAVFLVVGDGSAKDSMEARLREFADASQVVFAGSRSGQDLADSYAAMDLFAFASQSETQGMVLAEAMMAGKPVVAIDGPGVREVVADGSNGFLLPGDASSMDFAKSVQLLFNHRDRMEDFAAAARETAKQYTVDACTDRLERLYQQTIAEQRRQLDMDNSPWDSLLGRIEIEWNLLAQKASAVTAALVDTPATRSTVD